MTDPTLPSTEAVGEVRRRDIDENWTAEDQQNSDENALLVAQANVGPLADAGWLPPLAAEKLFEQRDTAIDIAVELRTKAEQTIVERDTAIRERDDWRKTALGLDEYITTQNEAIRRLAEERDRAIADLKAFSGEVERLYEVEREAERAQPVLEAAKAWVEGRTWPSHFPRADALAEAVDAYTKEASDG